MRIYYVCEKSENLLGYINFLVGLPFSIILDVSYIDLSLYPYSLPSGIFYQRNHFFRIFSIIGLITVIYQWKIAYSLNHKLYFNPISKEILKPVTRETYQLAKLHVSYVEMIYNFTISYIRFMTHQVIYHLSFEIKKL